MVFSSTVFLVYFLVIFVLTYWLTPEKYRNIVALAWSVLFFAWGAPKFIFIVLISVIVDFLLAKAIYSSNTKKKKQLLALSLLLNIGLLVYFKYANFFVENINGLLSLFNMAHVKWIDIALPIGISFFTFQKISYIVDVYRGKAEPLRKLVDLALYILLFPQLIAGPIVRFGEIKDQFYGRFQNYSTGIFINGFFRFSIGLGKKMLIANQIGELADRIFRIPIESLTMGQAWLGSLAYAFQIYFDFSGYSDMAIGLGLMMGFRFPENFNMPYIAKSITDFWKRWHITLSNWMKDYLYIPLGGNRVKSRSRLYLNLSIVFLISGIWHGAAWNFVAWGIFHGIFLIMDRAFLLKVYRKIGRPLSILITFTITLVGWVIFRSDDLSSAFQIIFRMFDLSNFDLSFSTVKGTGSYYMEWKFKVLFAASFLLCFLPYFQIIEKKVESFLQSCTSNQILIFKSIIAAILLLVCQSEVISSNINPFIYFRF